MKIIIIKNIPSPYRNLLFNSMEEILPHHNIDFEVWYMAKREPNRLWELKEEDFKYKHRFFKGIQFKIGRMFAHFTPSIIIKLLFTKYDYLIVGGAYSSPTHILLSLLGKKNNKILWSEGNLVSIQKKTGLVLKFKTQLVQNYNYFLVPGLKAKELIKFFDKEITDEKFISLPNLVDKTKFYIKEREHQEIELIKKKFNLSTNKIIWFSPSRLSPEKGLLEFAIHLKNIPNVEFIIAGEGPLREEFEKLILLHSLPVKLLGNLQLQEITELYKASDLFILPSFWDSSPLSVIEAIAAGLPILVSNKIGNLPDVLHENDNGWCYDPLAPEEVNLNSLQKIAKTNKADLLKMGQYSQKIYDKNFDNTTIIENLAKKFLKINS